MAFLTTVLLGSTLFAPPAEAAQVPKPDFRLNLEPFDLPMVDYNFPSGLRIIFQEDHTQPIVAVTVFIDKGSEADPPGLEGIAHVVEHMVFKAKHGDLPKNWDVLSELGAMLNASTSDDWTNYLTVVPKDSVAPIMRLEALRLTAGTEGVTAAELDTEREVVRNELRMRYENAAVGAAWENINGMLFPPEHPYGHTTIGSHDSLSNIKISDIQEFVKNNYTAANTTMVIVGDIDISKTSELISEAFDGLDELLVDPANPKAPIVLKDPPKRIDCAARTPPPAPISQGPMRVKGPVERETIVVAWSLPGGFCEDDPAMEMAANALTNYVYRTLVPSWEWQKQEQSIEGLGCWAGPAQFGSTIMCYVEPTGGLKGEKLISRVGDALYLQWDRELMTNGVWRPFLDYSDRQARASVLTGLFQGLDNVASLSGRATDLAYHAHFTGSAQYYADTIQTYNAMNRTSAMELAEKYLTRDRMVAVIVEPMDENDRAQREANAKAANGDKKAWEGATAEMSYSTVFDATALTPEAVMRTTVLPAVETAKVFTLSNGMKVTLMPHGSAPIVRAGVLLRGSDESGEVYGLDSLTEALLNRGSTMQESIMAVAGTYSESATTAGMRLMASGSSGNLDALLYKLRMEVSDLDWEMADKKTTLDSWEGSTKSAGKEPETWADRLGQARLLPGTPVAKWWEPNVYTAARAFTADQLKAWAARKYQPANAELIVVGHIDVAKAEASVKTYFENWAALPGAGAPLSSTFAPPSTVPDRQILVFDKKIATQSDITLSCQLTPNDPSTYAARQVLGNAVSERAFRKLREEGGLTYGAYAYTQAWPGGTSVFGISSLVQNNAVGYAVKTMFELADDAATGGIDAGDVARARWSIGRQYVYGNASDAQLFSRLASTRENGYDYTFYDAWRTSLANVTPDVFPTIMAPCKGHEVVTIVGPKEYAEQGLKDAGFAYEVVDWEKLYESTLSPKELKKRAKSKAKEEAEKAKTPASVASAD